MQTYPDLNTVVDHHGCLFSYSGLISYGIASKLPLILTFSQTRLKTLLVLIRDLDCLTLIDALLQSLFDTILC